jgi:transcriptional regulator with XRE-family HTH domain
LIEQLRAANRQSGLRLRRLGEASGVGADRLSRFLRGQRGLTLEAAEKICHCLRLKLTKGRGQAQANGRKHGIP